MSKVISSSSNKTSSNSSVSDENLLRFYQKKYQEFQKGDDKYKIKVDKHLRSLIADRHELEKELSRKSEKICDLQKAFVELQLSTFEQNRRLLEVSTENERLKEREKQLHSNIQQLLAMTRQKDLRDKIIYILKDPKIEIGYRTEFLSKSKSSSEVSSSVNRKLKEELDYVKQQLNEVLEVSKCKSDIVLEDCKQALEKSKSKIMQDGIQMKEFQKQLDDLRTELKKSSLPATKGSVAAKSSSSSMKSSLGENKLNEKSSNIHSSLKNMHFSLMLLLRLVSKVDNTLNEIQATRLFHKMAKIPDVPSDLQVIVENNTILQLESSLRQCTQLTFEINNVNKALCDDIACGKRWVQNINVLRTELKHLAEMLKEMQIITADNDLLNLALKRSNFFDALRDSSVIISNEDKKQHLTDFKKITSNNAVLHRAVLRAVDFVDSVIQKYSGMHEIGSDSMQEFPSMSQKGNLKIGNVKSDTNVLSLKEAKSQSLKDLEKLLGINKRNLQEAENFGLGMSAEAKLITEKIKKTERQIQEEEEKLRRHIDNCDQNVIQPEMQGPRLRYSDHEDILRKINKTLSKISLMEQGKFLKDEEMCRKLSEHVNDLSKNFKEFHDEFSVRHFQDQFSEYYRATLSKLEDLAKQCRDTIISAESQIAAHRSNASQLSEKLADTQELLRENINECLSIKQKLRQSEEKHETEKYILISRLKEKLEELSNPKEVEEIIGELTSYISVHKGTKVDPFICIYCKQGRGHELCKEKIKDLEVEERKIRTEMKLVTHEAKEEKASAKIHREVAEKTIADLNIEIKSLRESLKTAESKNVSLLDQVKVQKNSWKKMERYRRLEIEGFQTDIKNFKAIIQDLQKQLLKAVLIFENGQKDMELLKTVHETAQRSKQATSTIRRLKAKLYELENDIKSL